MAKRPVKLVFRSKPAIIIIVLLAVLCAVVATAAMNRSLQERQAHYEQLRQQAAQLEADNDELNQDIADLGSVESAVEIAGDELGLVLPDTVIFTPATD